MSAVVIVHRRGPEPVLVRHRERRNSARQRKIYDADFRVIADRAALALPVSFLTCHLSDKIGTGRTGYGGLRYTRAQWPARAMRRCARLSGGIRAYRAMGRVQLGMCRSPSQGDFSLEITGFAMAEIDLRIALAEEATAQEDDPADVKRQQEAGSRDYPAARHNHMEVVGGGSLSSPSCGARRWRRCERPGSLGSAAIVSGVSAAVR